MNNDLISREALKKTLCEEYEAKEHYIGEKMLKAIDNAPTVETPQGEWGKWIVSEIRCPNCLEYFQTECYTTEELKKCPICGAKMKNDTKQ